MIFAVILLVTVGCVINNIIIKYAFNKVEHERYVTNDMLEIGDILEIESIVENKKYLPVLSFEVRYSLPQAITYLSGEKTQEMYFNLFLLPFQRIKRINRLKVSMRGVHVLNKIQLSSGDLLGMKMTSLEKEDFKEVLVLPQKVDIEEQLVSYSEYYGDVSVQRWVMDDPILTIGLKEYTGMEPQKHIHWPSSLVRGSLMVKKFDYTADNSAVIILNNESSKPAWYSINNDNIEKCISFARAMAESFESINYSYGLITNANIIGTNKDMGLVNAGLGRAHLNNILEVLARMHNTPKKEFEETLQATLNLNSSSGTYVIITPVLLEEYIDYINEFCNKGSKVIVISPKPINFELLDAAIMKYSERGE
jgi:uncharacterized protein (DUF58 family)